jgi:transcriptional regulator with XRE-family HTH domain
MSRTQTVTPTRELTGRTPVRLRQNGLAIRCLREKDGWHQPEFARKVGMSQAALSNIEREKRSARPATIHRIAHALRVPVAAITRDYGELEGPAALQRLQGHVAQPPSLRAIGAIQSTTIFI